MTEINASSSVQLSNTLLSGYLKSTSSEDLNSKTIFNKLSIDMGSNGKTISKDQLDSYVKSAEKGDIKLSDEELKSLKTMQEKWDTISKGSDSITYANMSKFSGMLTSMDSADEDDGTIDLRELTSDIQKEINSYLVESAMNSGNRSDKSGMTSMLNKLLTGTTDENDDANADLIDTLVNLIAKHAESKSTIEVEA